MIFEGKQIFVVKNENEIFICDVFDFDFEVWGQIMIKIIYFFVLINFFKVYYLMLREM